MRRRYVGEEVSILPTWEESKLIWITQEQWDEPNDGSSNPNYPGKSIPHHNPSFWFEFNGWIYYGMVEYEFGFTEQYEDWVVNGKVSDDSVKYNSNDLDYPFFNSYNPSKFEFDMLVNFKAPSNKVSDPGKPYNTKYYKLDWDKANTEDNLDYYCEYETDFIKVWNRDRKINELID